MSKIEWTHRPGTKSEVLNPTTGCDKISQGCKNCYAEIMHRRLRGMDQEKYQHPFLGHVKFWHEEIAKPFQWKKPRTVFLNSMSDIFHDDITSSQIAVIYAMMFLNDRHTFIVLTKRAERAKDLLNNPGFWILYVHYVNELATHYIHESVKYNAEVLYNKWPLKNVWQGVSVEDQDNADERIPHLIQTPAHIRVLSCEPLLGLISLYRSVRRWQLAATKEKPRYWDGKLDWFNFWVIAGGESGHKARPVHPDWIRSLRDQCKKSNTPFFFKQYGEYTPGEFGRLYREESVTFTDRQVMVKVGKHKSGNYLDGVQHLEFPE